MDTTKTTVAKSKRVPRRTDPHRPGALIPTDYEHLLSYNTHTSMDGWPIPALGIDCARDRMFKNADGKLATGSHGTGEPVHCCVLRAERVHGAAKTGRDHGIGKCSVCGACFVYGDVWLHIPTGKIIHLGHDCADKYGFAADRSDWERENGQVRARTAAAILREQKRDDIEAFLDAHPGLKEDLELDHTIIQDIRDNLGRKAYLSTAQVALVRKLAGEIRNPPPPEVHVDAPEGRVDFTGTVVRSKVVESDYGQVTKITVKVTTDDGVWLAWGTCPRALSEKVADEGFADQRQCRSAPKLRGTTVTLRATLKRGRDPHFAMMSRPMLIELKSWAPEYTPQGEVDALRSENM
jgi:hypothetical protein